jgi:hypothetical protein
MFPLESHSTTWLNIYTFRYRVETIWSHMNYSETSNYRSRIIRFPGSSFQFLWSLRESYFNCGSRIYCFPGSIVYFSDSWRKRWIEVSLYLKWSTVVQMTNSLFKEFSFGNTNYSTVHDGASSKHDMKVCGRNVFPRNSMRWQFHNFNDIHCFL